MRSSHGHEMKRATVGMQFGRSEKAKWALLHSCLGLIAREIGRKQKRETSMCFPC